jgi:hypothetical protein
VLSRRVVSCRRCDAVPCAAMHPTVPQHHLVVQPPVHVAIRKTIDRYQFQLYALILI